jgi:hypothetical protein
MKRTTQIRLEPKMAAALRKIAKSFGFNQKQGPTTGQGSIVQFLEALVAADKAAPKDERILFQKILRAYLNHGILGDTRADTSADFQPPDQDAEK